MRSRMLKPGFFTNEQLAECEPLARILYAGLWCFADRNGCFEWRPLKMKAQIFPLDTCKIEPLLEQLINQQLLVEYSDNGIKYGFIPSFLKHQSPHHKEKESGIPLPNEEILSMTTQVVKLTNRNRNRIINKNIKKDKEKFGEFQNVELTKDEYEKLCAKLTKERTDELIERLDEYGENSPAKFRKYKSHRATITQWDRMDINKKEKDRYGI